LSHAYHPYQKPMAIIVGEGDPDSRSELEAFIAAKGLGDDVLLPGKVEREVLPDIYRAGDLYVLPSHVESNFLDAMREMRDILFTFAIKAHGRRFHQHPALDKANQLPAEDPTA